MKKWIQFSGLFKREIARFFKVPLQTLGAPIVNAALYLLIFGVTLGRAIHVDHHLPYLSFLTSGLIAMSIIKNTFDNATSSIIGQKYVNELQDHKISPLSLQQLCMARATSSLVRGLLVGTLTYLVGQCFSVFFEKSFLTIACPMFLLYFSVLGGLAFAHLGIAIGMWSKNFEHVGAISLLILLPSIYLGGVFFSLKQAPPLWQTLSYLNPLYYIIDGIRHGLLGFSDLSPRLSIGITFGFFLFSYLIALISLRKGGNYVR